MRISKWMNASNKLLILFLCLIMFVGLLAGCTTTTSEKIYVKEIKILTFPKIIFEYNEDFTFSGIEIEKILSDESKVLLKSEEYTVVCKDYNKNLAAEYNVLITLVEDTTKTTSYKITVSQPVLYTYELISSGTAYKVTGITEYFKLTMAVVPTSYNNLPITEIAEGIFEGKTDIISLTLPFNYPLSKLFGNVVPDTLKALIIMGGNEFPSLDKTKIEELTVSSSQIVSVPNGSISYNEFIKKVDLSGSENIESIGERNFASCVNLLEVNLSGLSKLKTIGDGSFKGESTSKKSKISNIDFTGCKNLIDIGDMSFQYLSNLKEIDLSKTSVKEFKRQIFHYCENLETIKLPASLEKMDNEFAVECNDVKLITVSPLNQWFVVEEGVLYDLNKTHAYKYPAASEMTAYTAPSTLKSTNGAAFQNSKNLTIIDLSACTLSNLAFSTFEGCSNAEIKVSFDEFGFNQNGDKVILNNNWAKNVKSIQYGERYLYFDFTISGLKDGVKTTQSNLIFTANAKYGDDECAITVMLNDIAIQIADGKFSLHLIKGHNVVSVKATLGTNFEIKVFNIEFIDPYIIECDLNGQLDIVYSDQFSFEFTVFDQNNNKVSLSELILKMKTDWGYGLQSFNGGKITETAEGTIKFEVNWYDTFYAWSDEGNITFNMEIEFEGVKSLIAFKIVRS